MSLSKTMSSEFLTGTNTSKPEPLLPEDSIVVPITSWIILISHTVLASIGLVIVFFRRNIQPIKSRNWVLLSVALVGGIFVIIANTLRLVYGRNDYPCFLYAPVFYVAFPFVMLPLVIRSWQLFAVMKLNQLKERLKVFTGREKTWFRLLNIMVSTKFFLSVIFAIMFVHSLIMIIVTSFDNFQYFTLDPCMMEIRDMIIILSQTFVYVIVQFIICILLLWVKDQWGIRTELYFATLWWLIVIIAFILANLTPFVEYDHIFPVGYVYLIGTIVDNIVAAGIPIFASFIKRPNTATTSEMKELLDNESSRKVFKKYALESFCVENVLCYEDIQTFKKIKNVSKRIEKANFILNHYLTEGSSLQVNIPHAQLETTIRTDLNNNTANPDLFHQVELAVVASMKDTFSRFCRTKMYADIMKQRELIEKVGLSKA